MMKDRGTFGGICAAECVADVKACAQPPRGRLGAATRGILPNLEKEMISTNLEQQMELSSRQMWSKKSY